MSKTEQSQKKIRQKNEKVLLKKAIRNMELPFTVAFQNSTIQAKFDRVNPPVPLLPPVDTGKHSLRALTSYYRKKILHKTILRRCGINDDGKSYRLYSEHTQETCE